MRDEHGVFREIKQHRWCGQIPHPRASTAMPPSKHGTGMPATAELDLWAAQVADAYGETCYQVGSSVYRKSGWRDVDVRMIMADEKFASFFPGDHPTRSKRWMITMIALSLWGQKVTGLPIDFQIHRRSDVKNADWDKARLPLGILIEGE